MSDNLDWLEIDDSMFEEIGEEKISSFSIPESGAHKVEIEQCFLRRTDKGAIMLELQTKNQVGQKINWSTCLATGDEKGNKTTFVKDGVERPLPGIKDAKHLFEAFGLDFRKVSPTNSEVLFFDKTIKAKVYKQLSGKKFTACVQQYENEWNGDVSTKLNILHFLDADGKNKSGEYYVDIFNEKMAKNPVKKLKGSTAAPTSSYAPSENIKDAGW